MTPAAGAGPGRERLSASALLVRSVERWIASRPVPPGMRSGAGRRLAVGAVFVGGVGVVLAVLAGWSPGSPVRVLLGVAAALLWTARVATLEDEALGRRRLGPVPVLAGAWLAGLVVLETCVGGWSGEGVVVLVIQSALAGGMTLVAWGKARLALRRSGTSGHGGRVSRD